MSAERLENLSDVFQTCIGRLVESVEKPVTEARDLAGIVKNFEITYEQAYKCLLELLFVVEAETSHRSVKLVFRRAFEFGWIKDEPAFTAMIADRNLTAHTYDGDFAEALLQRISDVYLPLFTELYQTLDAERTKLRGTA